MLEPTTQMSSSVGIFGGPRSEKPPLRAIIATLTPMPKAANIPVITATRLFGDTIFLVRLAYLKCGVLQLPFHCIGGDVFTYLVVNLQEPIALVRSPIHLLAFDVF